MTSPDQKTARLAREAAALRLNLLKRKQQQRARPPVAVKPVVTKADPPPCR